MGVVEEFQQAFDDVCVAVAEIAVLVVPHHEGGDAIEDEAIIGGFIF